MINPQIVERVLETALVSGADFAEIFAEDRQNTTLSYVDKKIDALNNGRDFGLGLRLIKGFEVIYAYTSDLSEDNLLKLAKQTAGAFAEEKNAEVIAFNALPAGTFNPIAKDPNNIHLKEKLALA